MKNKQPKDIVEILDELACHWDGTNKSVDGVIAMEASMEIERLRKELKFIISYIGIHYIQNKTYDELQAWISKEAQPLP